MNVMLLAAECLILGASSVFALTGGSEDPYRVRLGSVDMVPRDGLRAVASERGEPFVIQFEHPPSVVQRAKIENAGVELLRYVGGVSYLARCETGCDDVLGSFQVRATFDLTPAMKRAHVFNNDVELRARSKFEVVVRFFPWISWEQARAVLEESGATSEMTQFGYGSRALARIDAADLHNLLEHSEVAWVDPALPAAGPSLIHAAERSRVDQVRWAADFLGVDGSGTRVGVVDWFPADIHTDLVDRVTDVGVRWGESDHGTAVSGCVAGAGTLEPRATGMAPGASLVWTSWVPDPWTAMELLEEEYDVTIVNNSWNTKPGWWLSTRSWHGDLWAFGYYHERAAAADALVRDTDLLVLFSVGNKRLVSFLGPHTHGNEYGYEDGIWHEDLHPLNPRHPSIAGAAVAKNVLTVGGTTKDDEMGPFSSLGPTNDGRVKPDLVAVGIDVLTTAADDGYMVGSGTSLSSPVVAGVAALLTDFSRRRHGRDPGSAVLKNLLIHSARDLGAPGPDYDSGFGLADAELAARVLDAAVFDDAVFLTPRRPTGRMLPTAPGKATGNTGLVMPPANELNSLVIEAFVDHGETTTYTFPVAHGCDELRATLVWHDPPGPELVNDLDLLLVGPDGRKRRPFVLEPSEPSAAASRGINRRDNVEHIRVKNPTAGRWRVVVDGAEVPEGPQELALIVSAGEGNRPPERLFEGDLVIDEFFVTGDESSGQGPDPWMVFRDNDPLNFYIEATVLDNADYGDLNGSTAVTVSVSDAEGDTVVRFSAAGHGTGPGVLQVLLAVGYEIPAEMPDGTYTAHLELAMHNGVRRTAEASFIVGPPD